MLFLDWGFPPFGGGPFKYVDLVGAKSVVNTLNTLHSKYGERFKPSESFIKHAEDGLKFFPNENIDNSGIKLKL